MDSAKLKQIAGDAIDAVKEKLNEVSQELWMNPELSGEEHHSHDVLCDFLEQQGFSVQRHYKLETAFRAEFGSGSGPVVAVLCEYDALPGIGHACGHNLIAVVGAGAAIGAKAALQHGKGGIGKVVVLGTPDEEVGDAKIALLQARAFKDVDVAMMAHPFPDDVTDLKNVLAERSVHVTYHGRASHAAAGPWEGVNALDAAVMAYTSISCMRQQIRPNWRVHGIIKNGGQKPNIIPEKAELEYIIRTPVVSELKLLQGKLDACFKSAATATGCQITTEWIGMSEVAYNVITNATLAALYEKNMTSLGHTMTTRDPRIAETCISTDMGNVSHAVPSIHPWYYIGSSAVNHTRDFTEATGTAAAYGYTHTQAKALALTAVDIFCTPELLPNMKEQLKNDPRRV